VRPRSPCRSGRSKGRARRRCTSGAGPSDRSERGGRRPQTRRRSRGSRLRPRSSPRRERPMPWLTHDVVARTEGEVARSECRAARPFEAGTPEPAEDLVVREDGEPLGRRRTPRSLPTPMETRSRNGSRISCISLRLTAVVAEEEDAVRLREEAPHSPLEQLSCRGSRGGRARHGDRTCPHRGAPRAGRTPRAIADPRPSSRGSRWRPAGRRESSAAAA
jgi:hypothetical protein